jgi:hypothetical protein
MIEKTDAIRAIEQRAFEARATEGDVCSRAGILQSVWSRAKSKGRVSVATLRLMEDALTAIEAERTAS